MLKQKHINSLHKYFELSYKKSDGNQPSLPPRAPFIKTKGVKFHARKKEIQPKKGPPTMVEYSKQSFATLQGLRKEICIFFSNIMEAATDNVKWTEREKEIIYQRTRIITYIESILPSISWRRISYLLAIETYWMLRVIKFPSCFCFVRLTHICARLPLTSRYVLDFYQARGFVSVRVPPVRKCIAHALKLRQFRRQRPLPTVGPSWLGDRRRDVASREGTPRKRNGKNLKILTRNMERLEQNILLLKFSCFGL